MFRKGLIYTMKVDILKSGSLALVVRLRLPLDHLVSSTYSLPFCLVTPPEKKQNRSISSKEHEQNQKRSKILYCKG